MYPVYTIKLLVLGRASSYNNNTKANTAAQCSPVILIGYLSNCPTHTSWNMDIKWGYFISSMLMIPIPPRLFFVFTVRHWQAWTKASNQLWQILIMVLTLCYKFSSLAYWLSKSSINRKIYIFFFCVGVSYMIAMPSM